MSCDIFDTSSVAFLIRVSIEGLLTVSELSYALKYEKKRRLGADVFSYEFFKLFWTVHLS